MTDAALTQATTCIRRRDFDFAFGPWEMTVGEMTVGGTTVGRRAEGAKEGVYAK